MKKLMSLVLFFSLLLAACSPAATPATSDSSETTTVSEVTSSEAPPSSEPSVEPESGEDDLSGHSVEDQEVFAEFLVLDKQAMPVYWWYFGGLSDDMMIATESDYAPYHKVGKFKTIAEMKAATEQVFTKQFAETIFYSHAFPDESGNDTAVYKEIDGELYRNVDLGGMDWPYTLTEEYVVVLRQDNRAILRVKNFVAGDQQVWPDFLLKKEDNHWKFDIYYDNNPYVESPLESSTIKSAASSWLCSSSWTDPNELDPNVLLNFYMYSELSEVDPATVTDEKGYRVAADDVLAGLDKYLVGVKKETLVKINDDTYGSATYEEDTDSFYFEVSFDPTDSIVVNSLVNGDVTTYEIIVLDKGEKASYDAFLDAKIDGTSIKLVGNKFGQEFAEA